MSRFAPAGRLLAVLTLAGSSIVLGASPADALSVEHDATACASWELDRSATQPARWTRVQICGNLRNGTHSVWAERFECVDASCTTVERHDSRTYPLSSYAPFTPGPVTIEPLTGVAFVDTTIGSCTVRVAWVADQVPTTLPRADASPYVGGSPSSTAVGFGAHLGDHGIHGNVRSYASTVGSWGRRPATAVGDVCGWGTLPAGPSSAANVDTWYYAY